MTANENDRLRELDLLTDDEWLILFAHRPDLKRRLIAALAAPEEIAVGVDVTKDGTHVTIMQGATVTYSQWHPLLAAPEGEKAEYPEAATVCGEAYQVVGSLLSDLGVFDTPEAEKILDNLSEHRLVHNDVLPWPSFAPSTPPADVVPVAHTVDNGPGRVVGLEWNPEYPVSEIRGRIALYAAPAAQAKEAL